MDASLELKKHVGAIHVKGSLSLLQRKAVNVLMRHAYHELPDEAGFRNGYERSKHAAERRVRAAFRDGLAGAILRPAISSCGMAYRDLLIFNSASLWAVDLWVIESR